jgi:hypothetical protein
MSQSGMGEILAFQAKALGGGNAWQAQGANQIEGAGRRSQRSDDVIVKECIALEMAT